MLGNFLELEGAKTAKEAEKTIMGTNTPYVDLQKLLGALQALKQYKLVVMLDGVSSGDLEEEIYTCMLVNHFMWHVDRKVWVKGHHIGNGVYAYDQYGNWEMGEGER